jgi:hypothetical protein
MSEILCREASIAFTTRFILSNFKELRWPEFMDFLSKFFFPTTESYEEFVCPFVVEWKAITLLFVLNDIPR